MKKTKKFALRFFIVLTMCHSFVSCKNETEQVMPDASKSISTLAKDEIIKPEVITEPVAQDSDDPAIWINHDDKDESLVLGTDKDQEGALYAFDLDGKVVKTVTGLQRPNNVAVAYGFRFAGKKIDIAVVTERYTSKIRVFSLPALEPIDGGGIPVFEGETQKDPMGVGLYTKPGTKEIFAIVGRKEGPLDNYLWQYKLYDAGDGKVGAKKVRAFGQFSGINEIEAISVDNQLGYVYYSDEGFGVRKYYADPNAPSTELSVFATQGFQEDHEGIAIYQGCNGKGYIIVSDQHANRFHIFTREGSAENPHDHQLVKIVNLSTIETDGCEVTSVELNDDFEEGLFVAMSDDKTYHFYSWEDIMEEED